jgi:hypothetical protein
VCLLAKKKKEEDRKGVNLPPSARGIIINTGSATKRFLENMIERFRI